MNSFTSVLRIINRSSTTRFRNLSMPKQQILRMSTSASISEMQKEKDSFMDVLPSILDTLVSNTKFSRLPEVASWTKQVLEYNLQGGKKTRGLIATYAYEMLENPDKITEETLKISRVLGWCVEIIEVLSLRSDLFQTTLYWWDCRKRLQSGVKNVYQIFNKLKESQLHTYLLVVDDMMDGSSKRRGVPCWYCLPNVGLGAINDSILIHAATKEILSAYCKHLPQYHHIVELYDEVLLKTSMGQHLDYSMSHTHRKDYNLFTMERYNSIAKFKTAYYTITLPVCLGLLLANNTDPQTHKRTEDICAEIGYLFQMQDDFIDCFGVEKVTGKIGTDIQEGKCSWLAVQALQHCNPKQRTVFVSCYGSSEPAHIERIKRLYEELQLPSIYQKAERDLYDSIVRSLEKLPPNTTLPELFLKLLDMLYDRKK